MSRRVAASLAILVAVVALVLSACSSGPRKRVFPPSASVQELAVQADGGWRLRLRIQSFSNVPHTVSELSAQLLVDGLPAATLQVAPAVAIGPQSAEVEDVVLTPAPDAAARVSAVLESRRSVRYELRGSLTSTLPDRRRDDFVFEGQLWPVPGLSGVLR
mgnify:CR=1 FL=1